MKDVKFENFIQADIDKEFNDPVYKIYEKNFLYIVEP